MKKQIDASSLLDKILQCLNFTKDIQLAEYLGVSAQAIYQARKKNKVPGDWLIRVAQKGALSIDALLGLCPAESGALIYNDTPSSSEYVNESQAQQMQDEMLERKEEYEAFLADYCTVPLVTAKLSAGGGSLETEGQELSRMAFRREWLMRRGRPENMVLMRVYGDSMEPYIQDGDVALIDVSSKNIIPHTVYAVGVDDGIYIKALETLPGQRLILRSFNERYAPIDIDMRGDLADSVRIIGRVLWWCHEV